MQSRRNSSTGFWQYTGSFSRDVQGNVTKMRLGNGHWETSGYNNRGQVTMIGLGSTDSTQDLLKLEYKYDSTGSSHDNNGSMLEQKITVPTVGGNAGFTATQSYSYDALNRIASAEETVSNTQTWKQEFSYDQYGNRSFVTGSGHTTTLGSCSTAVCNPTISGNTTADANGQTYTYDGENKMVEASNSGGTLGEYVFDGDGKRVKKYVQSTSELTVFVYDASGKSIAEYSTIVANSTDAKVNYLTSEHLGSPRINTDAAGNIIARHDYHPFGEEIYGLGGRTTGLNYGDDSVRKQFTGYERDAEVDLDFAQARNYSSKLGRFNSCDPIYFSKEHPQNPQRWNLYVYVINNPLAKTDPKGLKPRVIDIFITISQGERTNNNAIKNWYSLRKNAPKGVQINIYTVDDKSATIEQFSKSLKSAGRTILVFGHSTATPDDNKQAQNGGKLVGQGIQMGDGESVGGTALVSTSGKTRYIPITSVKASEILLFTCRSGDTVTDLLGKMNGGALIYNNGGSNGETRIPIQEAAAYSAAEALIAGKSMTQARDAAQGAYKEYAPIDQDDEIIYNGKPAEAGAKVK